MVLAKIFDIFSKLVLSTKEESPTRMLAFQEMTNCAWDVLARNMHRNVEVTNVQEKHDQGVLSRACVSFLIALSSGGSPVDLESVARKMIRTAIILLKLGSIPTTENLVLDAFQRLTGKSGRRSRGSQRTHWKNLGDRSGDKVEGVWHVPVTRDRVRYSAQGTSSI